VARQVIGAALSLSGRFARFGTAIADGLHAWQELHPRARLLVEDDAGDPDQLAGALRGLAGRCDLLLGPYSTGLLRAAATFAADRGRLLWNHGGAGDDVQALAPGHLISTLTPARRYAEPFLAWLDAAPEPPSPLWVVSGRGPFSRQVSEGAATRARGVVRAVPADLATPPAPEQEWALFCSGTFEEDVEVVRRALGLAHPPQVLCAVAAGVQAFAEQIADPAEIHGVAQWVPGRSQGVDVGPGEAEFLRAHAARRGGRRPDYPAVQAAATASLAVHCLEAAGTTERSGLFAAATALRVRTLFGAFAVDGRTGAQVGHETVLVRWGGDRELKAVEPGT
jgi:ABC-type branched-subunit amino acid transport system substrate-binding protein